MTEVEEKIKMDLRWLKKGDIQKLADQMDYSRQHIYDVISGRVENKEVETALILLNEEREKDTLQKSKKAVKKIINS